ncbi:MAG: hypothetical protein NVS9B12_03760 [Vulcanimicrobiaceae bacterium]
MIAALSFEGPAVFVAGRAVRAAQFRLRSLLPVPAACVVANGVREALGAALGRPLSVRLLEPLIPDARGWKAILRDARIFGVRGALCDAALILRPPDARALIASVFAEFPDAARDLSPIEKEVVARALAAIAGSLTPVCGPLEHLKPSGANEGNGFLTYFELLIEGTLEARIGVALSRDPAPVAHNCLRIDDLLEVEVELCAEVAAGEIEAAELLQLASGTELRLNTKVGSPGVLKVENRIVARGECGVLGEHGAFVVGAYSGGGKR